MHIPHLLQNGDMATLAAETHRSIGSSGMIGANQFQNTLRDLEQSAKASDEVHAAEDADYVKAAWPATQSALEAKSYSLG